jgi:enamine deaminase RidA (YjgF/YER057c/UK114 family)
MTIQRTFSNAPWEMKVGYCRAIRNGNIIAVTGTTSLEENGEVHAPGDAYAQAGRCLEIIERALLDLGVDRRSVIRTRMFVTDISRWQEYGRAHGEFFVECPPATSMIEVKGLIDPAMLIEIEADAINGDQP